MGLSPSTRTRRVAGPSNTRRRCVSKQNQRVTTFHPRAPTIRRRLPPARALRAAETCSCNCPTRLPGWGPPTPPQPRRRTQLCEMSATALGRARIRLRRSAHAPALLPLFPPANSFSAAQHAPKDEGPGERTSVVGALPCFTPSMVSCPDSPAPELGAAARQPAGGSRLPRFRNGRGRRALSGGTGRPCRGAASLTWQRRGKVLKHGVPRLPSARRGAAAATAAARSTVAT